MKHRAVITFAVLVCFVLVTALYVIRRTEIREGNAPAPDVSGLQCSELLVILAGDDDPVRRALAAERLGEICIGQKGVTAALAAAVHDDHTAVRCAAVWSLGACVDEGELELRALLHDPAFKCIAARALFRQGIRIPIDELQDQDVPPPLGCALPCGICTDQPWVTSNGLAMTAYVELADTEFGKCFRVNVFIMNVSDGPMRVSRLWFGGLTTITLADKDGFGLTRDRSLSTHTPMPPPDPQMPVLAPGEILGVNKAMLFGRPEDWNRSGARPRGDWLIIDNRVYEFPATGARVQVLHSSGQSANSRGNERVWKGELESHWIPLPPIREALGPE